MFVKPIPYRFKNLVIFLSTAVLIITSCKIGEKDDNTTIIGEDGYNHIGSEVIGTAGGEINLDSIIVTIPSNTFDENTEINIFVGQENDGFDEYASSSLYQIGGLPSTINKPIRLSLKYHGTLEGDNLVAIGEIGYAVSLDSSLYSYHAESATDSAGYLVYDFPAYSSLAKLTESENNNVSSSTNIVALKAYKNVPLSSSNGHFKISVPMEKLQQGILMGEHFETAYTTCQEMGFEYPMRQWPANVLAKKLIAGRNGFYTSKGNDEKMTDADLISWINKGDFTINLNLLSDNLQLGATCGHEFLHLVQNLYEFSPIVESEQDWLMEATSVWVEDKYTNWVSTMLDNREFYPFDGWQYTDSGRKYAEQGYGLSVIIKEIADKYGDKAIIDIFKKIQAGTLPSDAVDPVDAVLSVLEEPVSEFWHRILGNYVLGHYYDNLVNFEFLDKPENYSGTFTIDAGLGKQSRSSEYHDLSGKLFKVKPGDLSSLDKVPLSFTVSDPINSGILVCKYKQGSEIDIIGDILGGSGQITIGDVKPLFEAGYELVVMVSNSTHDKNANYQGTNDVELTIEIKEPENQIEYLDFSFTLDEADIKTTFSTGAESYSKRIRHDLSSKCGESTFSDNIYTTIFDGRCSSITGYMTVTLLDNPSRVDVHAEWSRPSSDCISNYTVDYEGIPYDGPNGTASDLYYENGSAVSRINISQYEVICTAFTKELLNTNCENNAEIGVWVYYVR
ncbi:hypothetical protein ACFL3O_00720 [Candidatus Neomarinimicrobiota bacterium]